MNLGLRVEDIAKRAGLSKDRIYHLSLERDFPPPRLVIGNAQFWAREDIDYWLKTRKRSKRK